MRSCRQTLGRGRSCRGRQPVEMPDDRCAGVWSADTPAAHAAPLRGRGRRCQAHSGTMFDVKPGASADGSSLPGPTPTCRIGVDHHGGFVPAVPSLYKDEGAERLQSPNAATGKPLRKKTCTATGTLLEVPLTPLESRAAPPQPICGHLSSRRVRCNVRFGRSEGSLRQARGRAAASG